MSVEAITWALKEPVNHSSAKFVLVVLANCSSSESFEAYPSVKHISDATGQDRKTVLANLKRLIESGYISDTGKRVGQTGQVIVYQLNSTKKGAVKEYQKRNSTENGTVPNFQPNSTVFPVKESQISRETVPKTGHGTVNEPSIEPSMNHKKKDGVIQTNLALPDWLSKSDWDDFVQFRISLKKKMSDFAERLMVKNLIKIAKAHTPEIALEQMHTSMRSGWADVYPPKPSQAQTKQDQGNEAFHQLTGGMLKPKQKPNDAVFQSIAQTVDMESDHASLR